MIISIDDINNILPQTQCKKCTYNDCFDYAKAISRGENSNMCITGGQKTLTALNTLLNKKEKHLDNTIGEVKPRTIAMIDESMCIGCVKCILACPVDAIVGAKKLMHTVVESECTGCELCIEPCPMDCISLVDIAIERQPDNLSSEEYLQQQKHYKSRYEFHNTRTANIQSKQRNTYKNIATATDLDKKAYIAASLAKFRNKKKSIIK